MCRRGGMKNQKYIVLLVAVGALFTVGFYLKTEKDHASRASNLEAASRKEAPKSTRIVLTKEVDPSVLIQKKIDSLELTDDEIAARPKGLTDENWRLTVLRHRAIILEENGHVEFYGKIVDQDGDPIEGVEVSAHSNFFTESLVEQVAHRGRKIGKKKIKVVSDVEGDFVVSGYRAQTLVVTSLNKDGFLPQKMHETYSYSPSFPKSVKHEAVSSSPKVFVLIEESQTEPLIKKHWTRKITSDGVGYSFDLERSEFAKIANPRYLKISVTAKYGSGDNTIGYPWTISLDLTEGGLVVTEDQLSNKAPEGPYRNHLTWSSSELGGSWSSDLKKTIYIKGAEGEFFSYIDLHVQVLPDNRGRVLMKTLVNPAGSPILRYDPAKEIRADR